MLSLPEPYGAGNHEPAFSARNVRLIAPPKILKDKHIKLKLKANGNAGGEELRTEKRKLRTVFDAIGWNMAERLQQSPLLAGDAIDIAFTIGHNDHPDSHRPGLSLPEFNAASH